MKLDFSYIDKLEKSLGGEPHPENEHQKEVASLCKLARLGLWADKIGVPALKCYAENTNWLCSNDFKIGDSITSDDWSPHPDSNRTTVGGTKAREALENKP